MTRDLGKAGAFIETCDAPPVGSQLKVVVTLQGTMDQGMEARLCGIGTVRHLMTREEDAIGFGAEVSFRTGSTTSTG